MKKKDLDAMRLRMEVSSLWMTAKEQQVVFCNADPFEQIEEITIAFTDLNTDYDSLWKEAVALRAENSALKHDAINDSNEGIRLEAAIDVLEEQTADLKQDYDIVEARLLEYKEALAEEKMEVWRLRLALKFASAALTEAAS